MFKPTTVAVVGCLTVGFLSGCTNTASDSATALQESAQEAVASMAPAKAPIAGFDASEFSSTVRAQDDFFDFINAEWIAANDIPADRSRYGSFNVVYDRTELQVKSLIEAAASKVEDGTADGDEVRIGNAYLSFMNETQVDALGLTPLSDLFARIDSIGEHQELVGLFGEFQLLDINLPVVYYIDADAADPTRSLVYFWQGGLGLPDREYYTNEGEKFVDIRAKYQSHIENMYGLAGWAAGKTAAESIYSLEKALAAIQWSRADSRRRSVTYANKVDLAGNADNAFWTALLQSGGFGDLATVVHAQKDYFAALPEFINGIELSTWKAYLKFRVLESFAGYLPEAFVAESFAFRGTTLRGQEQQRPRWKRGVSTVNRLLGEQVGKLYVRDHFPPAAKSKITEMVDGLHRAFARSIKALTWMQEATKAEAQAKLAAFSKKVGYPDEWKDYSQLAMQPDQLVTNIRRGREFENRRQLAKLTEPVDRQEWSMSPQTVNASYRPTWNEIMFPAAILQAPFFDPDVDDAFNFGAIGAVIGHEFSHGFDDQGRKFDGKGVLRDWWTDADSKAYTERAAALVAQYDAYKPLDDLSINGKLTLGENIGDLAGLTMAYRAWQETAEANFGASGSPVIDGFTGAQRFFIGYAHAWRVQHRDEALREQLLRDPHSPGKYRVIGVLRNIDAFYDAFNLQPGDAMYLPPAERVRIW